MRGGFLSLPDIDKHNRNRRDKQHLASRKGEPAPLQASVLALRWRYPYLMGPPPALSLDASSQQIYVRSS